MTEMVKNSSVDYLALINGTALYQRPNAGLLRLSDADRADFLHRMTTNEINHLAPGQSAVTVLTNPTARIVQVFTVLCRDNELWLLPAPGEATALERHLRGQIFFMDHVKVTNLSEEYGRLRVMGATAAETLTAINLPVSELADGAWVDVTADEDMNYTILKQSAYEVPGYELLIPAAALATVETQLTDAGAVPITEEIYTTHRIALGRPAPGAELTDAYNPLEAGLGWTCADNKGCYTGQEIIARQLTYDKVTKTLVGLRSSSPLSVGSELEAEGRTVGTVTSSTERANLGGPIALAIVKRPYNEPGTQLSSGGHDVTVVALPFEA
ncbi:MAG: glycine cleavage T C-terminal barrel domain-containing protein [Caldilineaceae bacterium]